MYVMTIDQRGSSADIDRVPALLAELQELSTAARFERSVGDEVQGVVERPDEVVGIALHALRSGRWYVGIGVGAVDLPLPSSPRKAPARLRGGPGGRGECQVRVRARARRRRLRGAAQGRGGPLARRIRRRPRLCQRRGRAAADRAARPGPHGRPVEGGGCAAFVQHGHPGTHGTQKIAAQKLGITEQSVSRALLRSGWQEEWAARPAAEMLLSFAHGLIIGATDAGEQPDSRPRDSTEGDR